MFTDAYWRDRELHVIELATIAARRPVDNRPMNTSVYFQRLDWFLTHYGRLYGLCS